MIPRVPDHMISDFRSEDELEDGEDIFDDGPEPMTKEEREEEAAFWFNKPGASGFAPADFVYDPLSRRGFE